MLKVSALLSAPQRQTAAAAGQLKKSVHKQATKQTSSSSSSVEVLARPFHLAIPVHNVPKARKFYGGLLGCVEGRRDKNLWQDYNFFGHQLVCHFAGAKFKAIDYYNGVDCHEVPVPHFGVCLTVPQFKALQKRIETHNAQLKKKATTTSSKNNNNKLDDDDKHHPSPVKFIVPPYLRFTGQPGEQWTMFFKDPSGNKLEFKAMANDANLFAKYDVDSKGSAKKKKNSTLKKKTDKK